jgi:DNA modification methylase
LSRLLIGDCREIMRGLIAEGVKVQCVVTSPPYWGLRDYGMSGQLGLEPTIEEYVGNMVEVFGLARDLLADDGTLWLNLGDSYCSSPRGNAPGDLSTSSLTNPKRQDNVARPRGATSQLQGRSNADEQRSPNRWKIQGVKPKDLCGMPWRVAFALQADGWWLRQDIIWSKPNPMPESVRDRCTKAHEYLFLLAKSERYLCDMEAIAEPASPNTHTRLAQNVADQVGSFRANGGAKTNGPMKAVARKGKYAEPDAGDRAGSSLKEAAVLVTLNRNKRSVWTVATQPYSEAHFATFPPALIEPCILAGSRPGDIVFDPFMGSGTTGEVAQRLGRQWLGIELNPEYAKLAEARTSGTIGMAV